MASLGMVFGAAATGRVFAATAAKGGSKEEKSLVDWLLGKIAKEDQFYETDPILRGNDEEKGSSNGTASARKGTVSSKGSVSTKGTVSVQPKKKDGGNAGVFGGLFPKK